MTNTPRVPVVPTGVEGQTRLSDEAELTGKVTGGDFSVQGHVEGEIVLTGWLRVGRSGRVNGKVTASAAEVGGEFDGELRARVLVFTETARAKGRFLSERLIIREGARIDGAFDELPPAIGSPASVSEGKGEKTAQGPEAAADEKDGDGLRDEAEDEGTGTGGENAESAATDEAAGEDKPPIQE